MAHLSNYKFGSKGVNIVKNPLQLADDESTQLQNAELVPDQETGGEGSLNKRGGLLALNGDVLAGSVLGMISLPLQTTFVRTLYAFANGEDAGGYTAYTSTDGVTWVGTTEPTLHMQRPNAWNATSAKKSDERVAAVRSLLLYPGDGFTRGTSFPPLVFFDGTNTGEILRMPLSASSESTAPGSITDLLVANGRLYIAVQEPTAGDDGAGAVYEMNLDTGLMRQIANAFGNGTGETANGAPSCLAWYQGRLWVGIAYDTTDETGGGLVSCYPDIDTSWTVEDAIMEGLPTSLAVFKGDLYIGCRTRANVAGEGSAIHKRTASSGAYSKVFDGAEAGSPNITSLYVFNDTLFAVYHVLTATDILHVLSSTDGSSWSADFDGDAVFGDAKNFAGNMIEFNDKLYMVFKSTAWDDTDGFIYERTAAGVWTARLSNKGLTGPIAVLTERT